MPTTTAPLPRVSAGTAAAARAAAPGLLVAAVGGISARLIGMLTPVTPLLAAIAIGAVLVNVPAGLPAAVTPGLTLAGRSVLRIGIALLGFRLALGDVAELGSVRLALVAAVVAATFFGTRWLGRRLGVAPRVALLTATGFAICGASAVAAAGGASDAEEGEVAISIVLVTLYGTLAVVVLPLLSPLLGLDDPQFGAWVGASVHDVGQVVAAASTAGPEALHAAVVVKLCRVVLLAPVVAGISLEHRRSRSLQGSHAVRRPPLLPAFVVAFLVAASLRSSGILPTGVIDAIGTVEAWTLAIAMVGLGAGVRLDALRRVSLRPVLLGLTSWVLVAGVALVAGMIVG